MLEMWGDTVHVATNVLSECSNNRTEINRRTSLCLNLFGMPALLQVRNATRERSRSRDSYLTSGLPLWNLTRRVSWWDGPLNEAGALKRCRAERSRPRKGILDRGLTWSVWRGGAVFTHIVELNSRLNGPGNALVLYLILVEMWGRIENRDWFRRGSGP